jgi:PAS domain S-box-containing protein
MDAMRQQLRAREGSLREEGARLAGIVATQQDVALADLDMRVIMPLIATRARTLTGADGAVVELVEGDELVYHAVAGTMEGYLGTRLPRDGTLSGLAVRTGETLHCVDTATDPRTDSALCRRLGIGSMVVVPLRHGGRDVGVLKVLSSATHAFDERTVQTLQLVAGVLGAALGQGAAFAAVHASEERFRSVTESAHDAIVVADSRGVIVSWNAGARAIFGYQDDEVLGQPVTILLSEAYRAAHQRGVERLAARGTSRVMGQTLSLEGQRKDGAVFPLESSLATWTTAEGVFYSGIMRDVTERRQAENRLAATARTLEAKTREQEALIYTMSHDLKAPLVSLQGMAGVLLEDYADQLDHEARRYLDRIAANARKMQLLIDELLELSRVGRDAAETTPVALDAVVAAATEQLGHTLAARGAEVRVEGPLPRVPANATRLAQVFTNLIHNAIMYTPADRAPRVTIAARAAGDCWEISVHDNGVGILAAFHDKIFQVFQRLPEGKSLNPGGSGAGLAIVARVVEAHGGRIWLESVEEQGTTFYFTLPTGAAAGAGRPPHTAPSRHAAPALTNHDTLRTDAERVRP